MALDERRIPVIVGVAEINDRPEVEAQGLDSYGLMIAALREAEEDAGVALRGKLDWLGVVDQISFPDPEIHLRLGQAFQVSRAIKTPEPSGDGPILLLNHAANMIGSGEIEIAAIVGGEALRTSARRAQSVPATTSGGVSAAVDAIARPLWREYGLLSPTDVYPLYENAGRAAHGQSLDEAQAETAQIWSGMSKTAANNPAAWLRQVKSPADILEVGPQNRAISFPYTKLMVANSAVNQGAALIVMSIAAARRLGIAEDRFVHVGAGAAAHEPTDFLARDQYARSASLRATIGQCLKFNELQPSDIDLVEFYSCFPAVPKMIRRELDWPLEEPHSVYGGLTFGGGPIANCMMHAAAAMVRQLREKPAIGLIVANGGYATHSHSIILRRDDWQQQLFPQDFDVQPIADALRDPVPQIIEDFEGPAVIETYAVPYARSGEPARAVIIARAAKGDRVLAHVPPEDSRMLRFLTDGVVEPVGTKGEIVRRDGRSFWRQAAA